MFYRVVKRLAQKKELPFELSLEEFKWVIAGACVSCGEPNEPMSCDRVNSDYGYRFDNVQSLCDMCNTMKFDYSEEEFDQQIIKIIRHRPELIKRAGAIPSLVEVKST